MVIEAGSGYRRNGEQVFATAPRNAAEDSSVRRRAHDAVAMPEGLSPFEVSRSRPSSPQPTLEQRILSKLKYVQDLLAAESIESDQKATALSYTHGYIAAIENDPTIGFSDLKAELYLATKSLIVKLDPFKTHKPPPVDSAGFRKKIVGIIISDLKKTNNALKKDTTTWIELPEADPDKLKISVSRFFTLLEIIRSVLMGQKRDMYERNIKQICESTNLSLTNLNTDEMQKSIQNLQNRRILNEAEANQLRISIAELLFTVAPQKNSRAIDAILNVPGINTKQVREDFVKNWKPVS